MTSLFPRAASRAALISLLGGAASLAGQAPSGPPTQLAPVRVPGRTTDLVGVAGAASQGIVGAAELEVRPFLRRGELLEVIPGLVITQHSGDGKANQYFLRGFNLDHGTDFSIAVDGLPVNLRSHAHGQGYADLNFVIPEMVQQVDYRKGPYFAEVGDFSAAGAAEFRLFNLLPRSFTTMTVGENHNLRLAAGASRQRPGIVDTGAVEFTHDDGPWLLAEQSKRFNGFARRQWTRAESEFRVTAMAYHARWRSTDQIPLRAVEAGLLDRYGNVDPTDGGESERFSLSFDGFARAPAATTRFQAYALYYRLNLFSNFTYFLDDAVNGDQFNQRDRRVVAGVSLSRHWSGTGAGWQSETTAGLQTQADFIGELALHHTARRAQLNTVRDDDVKELSAGVFVRNEIRWGEWLRTQVGLRADGYDFDVTSDQTLNSGRRQAQFVSPKLGVVLGPWSKSEVYFNAGHGYHSNDARGTTLRVDPVDAATPATRVTPLVRSRGAEVGVRTTAVPGLVTSLAAWALELDSELVFVGDAGGTEPTDRTRRVGLELANFYRPNAWLALDADVSLTRARYRGDGGTDTRIANSVATVVTAGVTAGAKEGGFATVRLRSFGRQPLDESGSVWAPSSLSYNARVGWRARDWEIALDVLNLFDRQSYDIAYHYTSRLPGEPAAGIDDVHFHPAEPRTWRVNVVKRF